MDVRVAREDERAAAVDALVREWSEPILAGGRSYAIGDCQIFIAGEMEGLAAVSQRDRPIAELVAINALAPRHGVGSALLGFIVGALAGFTELRLTTTNDNVDALRFYQRRGFRLTALRPGAVDLSRRRKPAIPLVGAHGIPLRDELELTLEL